MLELALYFIETLKKGHHVIRNLILIFHVLDFNLATSPYTLFSWPIYIFIYLLIIVIYSEINGILDLFLDFS